MESNGKVVLPFSTQDPKENEFKGPGLWNRGEELEVIKINGKKTWNIWHFVSPCNKHKIGWRRYRADVGNFSQVSQKESADIIILKHQIKHNFQQGLRTKYLEDQNAPRSIRTFRTRLAIGIVPCRSQGAKIHLQKLIALVFESDEDSSWRIPHWRKWLSPRIPGAISSFVSSPIFYI